MDQSNNLVAAFNEVWNAAGLSSGMTPLIPGGLQWSREHMKAQTGRPYAQAWVSMEGPPLFTTGLHYGQRYLLECSVWCGADNTVLRAVDAALETILKITTKFEALSTNYLTEGALTLDIQPVPNGLDQEQSRSTLQNVGIVRRAWRVTLKETRGSV